MIRLLQGDCIERLRELPEESVHVCVTSPPYYGLRDYGVPGQLGLERTLDEYLSKMVEVFREVRRVLRSDGTLWLNVGDSFATAGGPGWQGTTGQRADRRFTATRESVAMREIGRRPPAGLKPKDLMMVPERLALVLQADGWWVRSRIIWEKKSAMPESVRDRPTKSHEHIWLLSKSETYYYDRVAASEPVAGDPDAPRNRWDTRDEEIPGQKPQKRTSRSGNKERKPAAARGVPVGDDGTTNGAVAGSVQWEGSTRNWRDVWSLGPAPFKEAHFATFPPEIPRRAIVAGTSERGCCPACGSPWVRETEPSERYAKALGQSWHDHDDDAGRGQMQKSLTDSGRLRVNKARDEQGITGKEYITTGWASSCSCPPAEPVPATVLDPFLGSGTTALVADRLQRDCIGIELNPSYAAMAERRIRGDAPLFAEVA